MTRFRIIGIFEDKICTSTEFNGDGYFSGHGEEVCKGFEKAKTYEDYVHIIERTNIQFDYEGKLIFDDVKEEELDFYELKENGAYYDVWFSDYLYIKNFTNEDKTIKDENGLEIIIKPNGWTTLYFGEFYEATKEDLELGNPHNNIEVNQNEKTYTLSISINAWVDSISIDAKSKQEAIEKLYNMTLDEILDCGCIKEFGIGDDIDIEED